jgi:hypothetical protein
VQNQISEDEIFCRSLMVSLKSEKEKYRTKFNGIPKFEDIVINCAEKSMKTVWSVNSIRYNHPDAIGEIVQEKLNQRVCRSNSLYSAYKRGWEFYHIHQLGSGQQVQIKAYCPMVLPSER